jgi:hypothetical protein
MTTSNDEMATVLLFRYVIASGDLYFSEFEQRDIFAGRDAVGRTEIWGQLADCGSSTKVELFRVFLEYALYCASAYSANEAFSHMKAFGRQIGQRLATYLKHNPSLVVCNDKALGALEYLFGTLHSRFFEDCGGSDMRFVVTDCPLQAEARRSGLPHAELARYGVNALCEKLCQDMDPGMIVDTLPGSQPEFAFTLALPAAA